MRRFGSAPEGETPWIVVGLGNPGQGYAGTRHNVGVRVIETLLARTGGSLKRHRSGCLAADARWGGERVVLARTAVYMNESGRPVRELVRWYKAHSSRLVVVHDELDIPFGEVRVKSGGGTAGHNGLGSLVSHLGSKDFVRVRVGISRPPGRRDPVDYVLSGFSSRERRELPAILERAADAVERIVAVGADRAMNEINAPP